MEINNCTWKFKLQCPRHWGGLQETADPAVHVCEACLENVYLCKDEEEATRRSVQGQCIALGFRRDNCEILMGRFLPAAQAAELSNRVEPLVKFKQRRWRSTGLQTRDFAAASSSLGWPGAS